LIECFDAELFRIAGKLSAPEQTCIDLPEQFCISGAGRKALEREAFSSGIRLGSDYPPAGPNWQGVSGACAD
jgi:hypothetical protein